MITICLLLGLFSFSGANGFCELLARELFPIWKDFICDFDAHQLVTGQIVLMAQIPDSLSNPSVFDVTAFSGAEKSGEFVTAMGNIRQI